MEENFLWQAYVNAARAIIEGKLTFENFVFCSPAEERYVDTDDLQEHIITYIPFRPASQPLNWNETEQNTKALLASPKVPILISLKVLIGAMDDNLKWPQDIANIPNIMAFLNHPRTLAYGYRIYANALMMLRGLKEEDVPGVKAAQHKLHVALTAIKAPITPQSLYYLVREEVDLKPRLKWLIEGEDYSLYLDTFRPNDTQSHEIALYLVANGFVKDFDYVSYYISHFTPEMLTPAWQQAVAALGYQDCHVSPTAACFDFKNFAPELAVRALCALLWEDIADDNEPENPYPANVVKNLATILKSAKAPELCSYVCRSLCCEEQLAKICTSGAADKLVAEILAIPPKNFEDFDDYDNFCLIILIALQENISAENLRRCLKNLSRWPKGWHERYDFISFKLTLKNLALPVLKESFFTNKDNKDYILFYADAPNSNEWKEGLKMILDANIDEPRKHQAVAYLAACHASTPPLFLSSDYVEKLSQFKASLPDKWIRLYDGDDTF